MTPGFFLVGVALILFGIPGTILGWIAAVRIRRSEGKLYGLRLAAAAALPLPMLLIASLLLTGASLVMRFGAISKVFGDTWAFIAIPVLATGLILIIKVFITLLKHLMKGEPIVAGFFKRMNRVTVITIILIWFVSGGLIVAARLLNPEPVAKPLSDPLIGHEGSAHTLSFEPEHEMTVRASKSGGRTLSLDLDRRELIEAPASIHSITKHRFSPNASKPPGSDQKIESWASQWGADLMFVQAIPKVTTAFLGGPLAHQPKLDYDTATPTQVLMAAESLAEVALASDAQPQVTLFLPAAGESIVFRTREGGVGLLELRESPEFPKGGVIVRYKTITGAR